MYERVFNSQMSENHSIVLYIFWLWIYPLVHFKNPQQNKKAVSMACTLSTLQKVPVCDSSAAAASDEMMESEV